MTATSTTPTSPTSPVVVPIKKAAKLVSEQKWTPIVMKQGATILPSLLFRAQARLGLNNDQLVTLLQICEKWWVPGEPAFPSKVLIADRMDKSERQVQRYLTELETAGFLKRIVRTKNRRQTNNGYDLSGLVAKLETLAPEFAEAAAQKIKVEKKGSSLAAHIKAAKAAKTVSA